MGQPVVHFEIVGKDGLFNDPEGHLIGVVKTGS